MLRITCELWPFGNKEATKRLVTISLGNIGFGGAGYDYIWTIDEPKPLHGEPISAQGLIFDYDRKAPCVDIIARIMDDYKNDKSIPLNCMTPWEASMCERMRENGT